LAANNHKFALVLYKYYIAQKKHISQHPITHPPKANSQQFSLGTIGNKIQHTLMTEKL
jgi:hypothetical protein